MTNTQNGRDLKLSALLTMKKKKNFKLKKGYDLVHQFKNKNSDFFFFNLDQLLNEGEVLQKGGMLSSDEWSLERGSYAMSNCHTCSSTAIFPKKQVPFKISPRVHRY